MKRLLSYFNVCIKSKASGIATSKNKKGRRRVRSNSDEENVGSLLKLNLLLDNLSPSSLLVLAPDGDPAVLLRGRTEEMKTEGNRVSFESNESPPDLAVLLIEGNDKDRSNSPDQRQRCTSHTTKPRQL